MAKLSSGMVQLTANQTVNILGQTYRKGDLIRPLNEITAKKLVAKGVAKYPNAKPAAAKKEEKASDQTSTKEAKPKTKTKGGMKQPFKKSE